MKTSELTFAQLGQNGTFPVREGQEVKGTLTRVRHAEQGTYIELAEHLGVYQTDSERDIR